MSVIKKIIVTVKADLNYLAYPHIITMARVKGDPKYQSYRHGRCLKKPVEDFLNASGVDLSNGVGFEEFRHFKTNFRTTKVLCLMV